MDFPKAKRYRTLQEEDGTYTIEALHDGIWIPIYKGLSTPVAVDAQYEEIHAKQ